MMQVDGGDKCTYCLYGMLPIAPVLRPLDGAGKNVGNRVCGFHRQKIAGDFSDRDKEIVNILLPHLARAIRNLDLIRERELSKEQNGVIVIDEDGKPFYMNRAARLALKGMPAASILDPGLGTAPAFFRSRAGTFRVRTLPFGKGSELGVKVLGLQAMAGEQKKQWTRSLCGVRKPVSTGSPKA